MLRRITAMLLFTLPTCSLFAQLSTFTSSATQPNGWGGSGSITIPVTVSGLPASLSAGGTVLRQINMDMGDGSTNYSWFRITATLTSPGGTVINIGTGSGTLSTQDFGQTGAGRIQAKYRDHSQLYTIGQYATLPIGTSLNGWPYHLGYYRVKTAGSFAGFNGGNPNGTWNLTISHNGGTSPSNRPQFNSVSLVFGPAFVINNVTSASGYDACSGAQCIQSNEILIADDMGFSDPGPATDPALTLSGCQWNTQLNNTSWYRFVATGTTANITVSAYSNMHQLVAVGNSGSCASPTYTLLTGGCPVGNITYSGGGSYSNGSGTGFNHALNLSGLTAGNTYYLVIDGTGISGSGNQSQYYIELVGGNPCSSPLPIELISLEGKAGEDHNSITWTTASETNNWYFTLERSENGVAFQEVARIDGAGNSNTQRTYEWKDFDAKTIQRTAQVYYRLKQTDYDGTESYEGTVVSIQRTPQMELSVVSANRHEIVLRLGQEIDITEGQMDIYTADGKTVLSVQPVPGLYSALHISGSFPQGLLIVTARLNGQLFRLKCRVE